jgi:uncharacterized damage-inducible protein DinB
MNYDHTFLEGSLPASRPIFQHLVDTYASETNKTAAVWSELRDDQLDFKPHSKSGSVREILAHQILSERRFFAEFIGLTEPAPPTLLPAGDKLGVKAYAQRYVELATARLPVLAAADEAFWLTPVTFFDVTRERIWVFWRRVLHTTHHRAQVGVYLRLLEDRVPATYGPTADVSWKGADPTRTVDAAGRGAVPPRDG